MFETALVFIVLKLAWAKNSVVVNLFYLKDHFFLSRLSCLKTFKKMLDRIFILKTRFNLILKFKVFIGILPTGQVI